MEATELASVSVCETVGLPATAEGVSVQFAAVEAEPTQSKPFIVIGPETVAVELVAAVVLAMIKPEFVPAVEIVTPPAAPVTLIAVAALFENVFVPVNV